VKFEVTDEFWRNFYALSPAQKKLVREKWKIFKADPFDPKLRSYKIQRLSGIAGHPIFSAVIAGDLRVTFRVDGSTVTTLDVGTHDIYK